MDQHTADRPSRRILVVEDADDARETFARLLQADGADVVATGSGREAIEILTVREIDVLVTDLGLPDVPGDLVIREAVTHAPHRPWVVVVTGFAGAELEGARRAGADVVLIKPVPWELLLGTVHDGVSPPEGTGGAPPPGPVRG
jgi:CheY-like chemotaxis protein